MSRGFERASHGADAAVALSRVMAAVDPVAELAKLLERAREISGRLPQSACVNAMHQHIFSALALAEHLKAGRAGR